MRQRGKIIKTHCQERGLHEREFFVIYGVEEICGDGSRRYGCNG